MKRTDEFIVGLERAIKEKYGEETTHDPSIHWNEEKEKEYLKQLKDVVHEDEKDGVIEVSGVLVSKKLFNRSTIKTCKLCNKFCMEAKNDLYLTKYDCCEECFIIHIEGREDKWRQRMK